jgi:hypothetical protein
MKKILLFLSIVLGTLLVNAQEFRRPLPNQFRDFVDFHQRPKIEKKDGMVTITMSEENFKRMQMNRQRSLMMMAKFQQHHKCKKCEIVHRKRKHKMPPKF